MADKGNGAGLLLVYASLGATLPDPSEMPGILLAGSDAKCWVFGNIPQ